MAARWHAAVEHERQLSRLVEGDARAAGIMQTKAIGTSTPAQWHAAVEHERQLSKRRCTSGWRHARERDRHEHA